MTVNIQITQDTYKLLHKRSREMGRDPNELANKVLHEHLLPTHPYIEVITTRSGSRAVLKNTRVAVNTIVGYVRLGESPESIAESILPHLTLAQIYDALSYYHDHQDETESELIYNTEAASQERLRVRLGEATFHRLTGQDLRS